MSTGSGDLNKNFSILFEMLNIDVSDTLYVLQDLFTSDIGI